MRVFMRISLPVFVEFAAKIVRFSFSRNRKPCEIASLERAKVRCASEANPQQCIVHLYGETAGRLQAIRHAARTSGPEIHVLNQCFVSVPPDTEVRPTAR
jgi:hypothetical protein